MKTIISIAALVALTACGPTAANFTRMQTEPATLSEVLTDIRYRLKDPSSAEFRDVRSYAFTGQDGLIDGSVICGMVNARNSYGGFTGFTPFRASVAQNGTVRAFYMNDFISVSMPCGGGAG